MAIDFPSSPTIGQQFTGGNAVYQWDGTGWNIVPQLGPIFIGDAPPANPAIGQQWWRSTKGQLYVWYNDGNSAQWVQSAGAAATPGLWESIGTPINLAGLAQYDWTNLGAYRALRMALNYKAAAASAPVLRYSADNGATFDATNGNYVNMHLNQNGATLTGVAAAASTGAVLVSGNLNTNYQKFDASLSEFNQAAYCIAEGRGACFNASGAFVYENAKSYYGQLTPRNALRLILIAATTFTSGIAILEGVRG